MNGNKTVKKTLASLAVVALSIASSACERRAGKPHDDKITVVTTFTIIADMAREVAGDAAVVESLIKPGAEVHGYEPTPKDIVRAQQANLILSNGMNLEAWFAKFFQHLNKVPNVVVSEGIAPINIDGGPYTGKPNPHAWMSPILAQKYVDNICEALVKADAKNESVYRANAKAYKEKIQALDAPLRATLEKIPAGQRQLVTSEGAFSYLCRDYGMQALYLWPINADSQGTPQQVQAVIDAVRAQDIPVLFSESTVSDKPMRQVAKETRARYGGVLYVDSLTDDQGPAPTYLRMLQHNAETIARGFLPEHE
jgi:manganese/iron transport system substrate-binding protein